MKEESNENKILKNYKEPYITIEYLFIERANEQLKPINDDPGYQMGFFNIFISGTYKNDNVLAFKTRVIDELNYSLKTYDHFKSETIDLSNYKFGLVNNDREVIEFTAMDDVFFKVLMDSIRNLMIVGTNFEITKFKVHDIFNQWFDNYTIKT
jgi:hypothetical protein